MAVAKGSFRNYVNMYEFETVLPGSGDTITFRPVTTGQIKRLLLYETSNDALSIETALDELITECIVKPENFDVGKLYLQDRFFLLVDIRKATRGNAYSFQTTCTSCGSQTQQILNISDLVVTKLNKEKRTQVVEPPVVEKKRIVVKKSGAKFTEKNDTPPEPQPELPPKPIAAVSEWDVLKVNDNISVRLSLVTREMQRTAGEIFTKETAGKTVSDVERTLKLTSLLFALSINGIITPEGEETELSLEDRLFLLDNIQQSEQEKISGWFDKNDFGIDFSFDITCVQCKFKEKKAVPVENFFY